MNLFGPSQIKSMGRNYYGYVVDDDFSRFPWIFFLAFKSETYNAFIKFVNNTHNSLNLKITSTRSDHENELVNHPFEIY